MASGGSVSPHIRTAALGEAVLSQVRAMWEGQFAPWQLDAGPGKNKIAVFSDFLYNAFLFPFFFSLENAII